MGQEVAVAMRKKFSREFKHEAVLVEKIQSAVDEPGRA